MRLKLYRISPHRDFQVYYDRVNKLNLFTYFAGFGQQHKRRRLNYIKKNFEIKSLYKYGLVQLISFLI